MSSNGYKLLNLRFLAIVYPVVMFRVQHEGGVKGSMDHEEHLTEQVSPSERARKLYKYISLSQVSVVVL
jgi:hypothetical protein